MPHSEPASWPISKPRSRPRGSRRLPPSSPRCDSNSRRTDRPGTRESPPRGMIPAVAASRSFLDLTLAEWLDALAGARAAPGGGSALAVAVANAAAVLAMAARVSDSGGHAAQAEALRARIAPLAQLDAETYEAAIAVRDAAREMNDEQRDWKIVQAFSRAAEPPLEIARAALDVAELAE